MVKRGKSVLALMTASLLLAVSGYAATGGVSGLRSDDRPSQPGNGHCGKSGGTPPCKKKDKDKEKDKEKPKDAAKGTGRS
jgi:hypothetical protein